jgi:hypothetical protein
MLLAFLLANLPVAVAAQSTVPIGRPNLEYPEAFSYISAVRELSDGRVIVADSPEKTLQLIDLLTGAVKPISREGRGPGEYLSLVALLPQPGDQTLLADMGNRRFLKLGSDGTVLETIALPRLAPSSAGTSAPMAMMATMSLLLPRGTDRYGRLYFEPSMARPDGAAGPDSVPVQRWTPGTTRIDTVRWVRSAQSGVVWAPVESWQVGPNAQIVRLRPSPYQLVVTDSLGRSTTGPAVPYTPIRIPEAERQERQKQRDAQVNQVRSMAAAAASGQGASASRSAPSLPDLVFAETKPPFLSQAASVAPDGQIWVLRTRAYGDSIPVYDVFDPAGRLQRRVSLAAGSRLLGFGRGTVYISRKDEDDLEYLQRYAR